MSSFTPAYWPQATAELSASDPIMAALIAGYPGELMRRRGDAFFTLARAITGQQISVKAADSVWAKLTAALGEVMPERVLEKSADELRACGLSQSKAKYLHALAEAVATGRLAPESWSGKDDDAVIADLVALPGIGRWTAEMLLIFHLARPDVLPLADLGLVKAVERHYFNGEKSGKAQVAEIAERWRPWRSVATWYLWRSLDPLPVAY